MFTELGGTVELSGRTLCLNMAFIFKLAKNIQSLASINLTFVKCKHIMLRDANLILYLLNDFTVKAEMLILNN